MAQKIRVHRDEPNRRKLGYNLLRFLRYSLSRGMSRSAVIIVSFGASETSSIIPQGAITALLPPLRLEQTFPTLMTNMPFSEATFSVNGCPLTLGCVPMAATGRKTTSAPSRTVCFMRAESNISAHTSKPTLQNSVAKTAGSLPLATPAFISAAIGFFFLYLPISDPFFHRVLVLKNFPPSS